MKTRKYYYRHLMKYYKKHYGKYDEEAAWYVMPADNIWLFKIPSLNRTVELVCDDNGVVIEINKKD